MSTAASSGPRLRTSAPVAVGFTLVAAAALALAVTAYRPLGSHDGDAARVHPRGVVVGDRR